MKRLILLLVLLVHICYPMADLGKPTRKVNNERFKKAKNGAILLRVNSKGEVVEQYPIGNEKHFYDFDGTLTSKTIHEFDEKGNLKLAKIYDTYSDTTIEYKYTTGSNGQFLKVEGDDWTSEFFYDNSGKIDYVLVDNNTTKFLYNEDETISELLFNSSSPAKYVYDDNKREVEYIVELDEYTNYITRAVYDDDGYIIEHHTYEVADGYEELIWKAVYVYYE